MFANIQKIFEILDYKKKREFKILVVLMFIAMLLETIGISSMIPLINYFTNENILATHNINFKQFLLELGISQQNILNFILVFIILVFLIKNLYMGLYGPLSRFKEMIKGDSYNMLLNHISHKIVEIYNDEKKAVYEVTVLDTNKKYFKFRWQVEKFLGSGRLKNCWLTTVVSQPIPLGSSV